MNAAGRQIALICTTENYNGEFIFIKDFGHTINHYESIAAAVHDPDFIFTDLVIIAINGMIPQGMELTKVISEQVPDAKIIIAGELICSINSADIPRTYYLMRRPIDPAHLTDIITGAMDLPISEEGRREPRHSLSIPVEIFAGETGIRSVTTNLSLHGMQAVFPQDTAFPDMDAITACRLVPESEISPIELGAAVRYIISPGESQPGRAGFEFCNVPLENRLRLYKLLAG